MTNPRTLLVTGATGSFGTAFVRYAINGVDRLVVFSRDELKQYDMQQSLADHPYFDRLRFFLGDVRDKARLKTALRGVHAVVHAAALKQVPAAEYNPFEAVQTNVLGAQNLIEAAIEAGVHRVVALSTDKAVNPVNLYGATKLTAEKLFVAARAMTGDGPPYFTVVRYGNVLGSRGSVVPAFRRQAETGRLSITDERMTRFWITLPQACALVAEQLEGADSATIVVPRLPTMRIVDLAKAIAPDAYTITTGIRPGEKLHETLIAEEESPRAVIHPTHYVIHPDAEPLTAPFTYRSDNAVDRLTVDQIRSLLDEEEL